GWEAREVSARSHSFQAFGPAGSVLAKPSRRSPHRNPHRLAYPHRSAPCNPPDTNICWNINPLSSEALLRIGTLANDESFFNGYIDEVAIFSRKLTAPEVLRLYNASR
ncbi:MAG: LamG domain-containing protein, partial [Myxococcota bacterium]|nr:LamG domain-containing protein [Myxococcota bacterium]